MELVTYKGWMEVGRKKKRSAALASVAQLVEALTSKPKGDWFNSRSGHLPGLQAQSLVSPPERHPINLLCHINVPLPLSLPPLPPL